MNSEPEEKTTKLNALLEKIPVMIMEIDRYPQTASVTDISVEVADDFLEEFDNLTSQCLTLLYKNGLKTEIPGFVWEVLRREDGVTFQEWKQVLVTLKSRMKRLLRKLSAKIRDPSVERIVKGLDSYLDKIQEIIAEFIHPKFTRRNIHPLFGRVARLQEGLAKFVERNISSKEASKVTNKRSPREGENSQVALDLLSYLENYIEPLIEALETHPDDVLPTPSVSSLKESVYPTGNKVFIVHGHDEANRLKLIDLLKNRFKIPPSVIMETPGRGRTIIEIIEEVVPQVCFAFILMTPDDEVVIPEEKGKPVLGALGLPIKDLHTIKTYRQPRPNVLIELGLFYGAIARQNVCLLLKEGTKLPSDLDGIKRIQFKDSVKEVIEEIEAELRAAELIE